CHEGNNGPASGPVLLSSLVIFAASFAHEARAAPANATAQTPIHIAQRETRVEFNIPRLSLVDALAEWSKQSGLQVLRRDADGDELTASSVNGRFSPAEALEK